MATSEAYSILYAYPSNTLGRLEQIFTAFLSCFTQKGRSLYSARPAGVTLQQRLWGRSNVALGGPLASTLTMALAAVSAAYQVLRGTTGIFTSQSTSLLSRARALYACSLNRRKMTSKRKTDHLERTANKFRQEIISPANVCGITDESATVKRVRLAVANSEFSFKAGQW
ncbi:oxidoreductase NAD-binding domain-containing 1 [Pelobates cultripes]|uniref:Oxidoreductase NAD-binding domain-containing 1 n=1 Tax=Pelobates cultripes TaxID=61616 RepID=A0AAD1RXJ5_PELCU|nr:oxidoreductase NAD-binding domain-containing 1 [Pelobates cultripes]